MSSANPPVNSPAGSAVDPRRGLHPRLQEFVDGLTELADRNVPESEAIETGGRLLKELVISDDWLDAEFTQPHPQYYQQYLLYADPLARFSVVSFVWGPGQATPIHDHTVWGLIGMLRGAEYSQGYAPGADGGLRHHGAAIRLEPGDVSAVSPAIGDVHRVHNAYDDRVSISIHVYGADIGAVQRHTYKEDGSKKPFVSGYSNAQAAAPSVSLSS